MSSTTRASTDMLEMATSKLSTTNEENAEEDSESNSRQGSLHEEDGSLILRPNNN